MSIGGSCIMLYLSLSLCPSLCPFSMTLCPSLSPSPCLSISMSFSMSFSMVYLSISVYICLHLPISESICLYLSISVYICLYLSISVHICLYLSISVYIYLYFYLYFYLSINQSVYLWYKYCPAIINTEFLRFSCAIPIHPPGHHQHRFGARFCGPGSLASGHWDEQPDLVLFLRRPGLGPVRQRTGVHWERGKRELERHTRLRAGDVWEMMRWGI